MVESLAQLPPVAQPWAGEQGPGGPPAYGLTAECSSFLFFLFFPLPKQGTAAADIFHVAGFWPDDV